MRLRKFTPLLLAVSLWMTACADTLTGPGAPLPAEFARCDDPFSGHRPPAGHGDVFVTPEQRARAQAEVDRVSAILDRHVESFFAIPGVLSTGVGYAFDLAEFVIVVGYDQAGACPTSVPARIEGVRVMLDPASPAVAQ